MHEHAAGLPHPQHNSRRGEFGTENLIDDFMGCGRGGRPGRPPSCLLGTTPTRLPTTARPIYWNESCFLWWPRVGWQSLKSVVKGLLPGGTRRRFAAASTHYRIGNPYHSVSIVAGAGACNAARELQGHRFLSREAPHLPLSNCPLAGCRCAYKHHDDRRQKRRRKADRTELPQSWSGLERRQSHGRRTTDPP
jgi:hypothetical protein